MAAQPEAAGEPGAKIWDEKGDLLPQVKKDAKKEPAASKRKSKDAKRKSKDAKRKSKEKSGDSDIPPSAKKKKKKRSSKEKEVPDAPGFQQLLLNFASRNHRGWRQCNGS